MGKETITIFILLILYFVGMTFVMNAIGKDFPFSSETTPLEFCKNFNVLTGCTEKTFLGNVVTSVQAFPLWLNTIAFIIPFLILIFTLVIIILHGG